MGPFTKNDGFMAFTLVNCSTRMRHLCVLMRKSQMCQCGCKGWCSMFVALSFMHYCLTALAAGFYPLLPFGRSDWIRDVDDDRASMAGLPLICIGAMLYLKGDWEGFASVLGYPTWSSLLEPCFCCDAEQCNLHSHESITIDHSPWQPISHFTYNRN